MKRHATLLCALPFLAALSVPAVAESCSVPPGTSYPAATWEQLPDPAASGWSMQGLAEAGRLAGESGFAALVVTQGGRLVYASGETAEPYNVRSIRKSLLNAVIGLLVRDGKLNLDATLAELGIDDDPALSEEERRASVRDLLMSRSGVYHQASYTASREEEPPARGSHPPGTYFFYNNWDFNALGSVVNQAAGRSLYDEFAEKIAAPIGMQDFNVAEHTEYRHEDVSRHPAYLFSLSARDLTRFGLLYLRQGCWNGEQLIPAQWIADSVAPQTLRGENLDYGYLWWSQGPVKSRGLTGRIYMARGNGAQVVWIIPELDVVMTVTTDTSYMWFWNAIGMMPQPEDAGAVLYAVLDARPGAPNPVIQP